MPTSHSKSKKRKTLPDVRETQSEKIVYTYGVDLAAGIMVSEASPCEDTMNMEDSVAPVESILRYYFKNKSLLEEALTHPSYTQSPSYQRLEFIGDSILGTALSIFLYSSYPDLPPGQLSVLRAANISTERLARVAVRNGLNNYIRHNTKDLDDKVREFVNAVEEEDEMVVHGGQIKAPKVLADIVESVVGAVFQDCGFDLPSLWAIIRELLEPLVMLDVLEKQPQPITSLFEACQKQGKNVDIKHRRKGKKNIASVHVDGRFVASSSSNNKENAKLRVAQVALSKLKSSKNTNSISEQMYSDCNETNAKQKLHQLCTKKRWSKPIYRVERKMGPAHDRRYISSVQIELCDTIIIGDKRSKVKDSENSAALVMFCALRKSGYV